jgi:hypothetical protein
VVFFVLIELGCTELGVACQVAHLPVPPPLFTVRGGQRMSAERARQRLVALGLIDPLGAISTGLHQAMCAFAQSPVEVDLRFTGSRGATVGAAVATLDGVAFLAVVTNGHVRFSRVPAEAAVAALVHVLPREAPARGAMITLPVADVDAAVTRSMEHLLDGTAGKCHPDADTSLIACLAGRGVAGADARLFASLTGGKRLRFAEFGVTCRDRTGARHRSGRTVQVVDTRRGRAVLHTRGDYLVAAPADAARVVGVLTELRDGEFGRLDGNRLG